MLIAKEKFLDRVEQSFVLFKNNFLSITLPFIIFNILFIVIVPAILMNLVFANISFSGIFSGSSQNIGTIISLLIVGALTFAVIYLVLLIPVQIGLIKSVKQAIEEKEITAKENILYGFTHLADIFKTYWYIFAYVLLIPALIFIAWGFIMLAWLFQSWGNPDGPLVIIWSLLMWLGGVLAAIYSIYRGVKATFSIISAVDTEEFTKDNFKSAVLITKGKWWRIVGNLFAVGFIGGLLVGLVSWLGNAVAFSWTDFSALWNLWNEEPNISEIISQFTQFNPLKFLNQIFQNTLWTILGVFISVFSYVFFIRLREEYTWGVEKTTLKIEQEEVTLEL